MKRFLILIFINFAAYGLPPKRVASFSLSTDLWLHALKQPNQKLFLTSKSKRYGTSTVGVAFHNKRVESLIQFKPDLVLCDDMTGLFTQDLLRKCGLTLHFISSPQSLQDLYESRTSLYNRLELKEPQRLALPRPQTPLRALILLPGRLTCGEETFLDDLLTRLGHKNCVASLGKKGWGTLPVEDILRLKPQVIFTSYQESPTQSRARSTLAHTLTLSRAPIVNIPEPWMLCPQLYLNNLISLLSVPLSPRTQTQLQGKTL